MTRLRNEFPLRPALLFGAIAWMMVGPIGCSRPAASVDISGTWIQETGTQSFGPHSEDDSIQWRLDPKGTFSQTAIIFGKPDSVVTGTYKIRPPKPEFASIPGEIIECSSPTWESPKLLRVPPHSSTLLIRVNCDDDSFSGSRPECWLRKTGSSPLTLEVAPKEITYTGTITQIKPNKSSQSLLLDTRVHGKQLECAIIEDDVLRKLGDLTKLLGQRIEVKGKPEEYWKSVLMFIEDDGQLRIPK